MESIWQNITTALEIPSEVADKWLAKLKQQYNSQSNRHYHNEEQMIHRKAKHLAGASICVQLACLFQYYHFDAGKDCVEENCGALKEFFAEAKLENKSLENNTLRLLGDVAVESSDLPEEDVLFFQDLDLLILGRLTIVFQILQTLNRIPSIYASKELGDKYEQTARTNIGNEIKELENQ
ncbi:uncharacterized protein LOC128736836 [Sabethes cyaneus]|uniref:uncharacterized protein LOC128736836 n=1 Tax=Sabethes cyaneus TaxID=53552 RepID=UPI00237D3484|nr:uncharacterized protein LOC128736836 [Sabethes cyaneus]